MRIALACNGEGFGHAARTVAIHQALEADHEIWIFAPPTVHDFLQRRIPGARLIEVSHLHLAKRRDRIDYLATLLENIPVLASFRTRVVRLSHVIKRLGIEAMVNDYEPFSALAARRAGVPVLQFNHPGIVITSPSFSPDALMAKLVARLMMSVHDRRILCSFYNGDVGPMVRKELADAERSSGDYLVVSLKESLRKPVLQRLHRMGIYNYRLFPDPAQNYVQAVAGCRAIITTAGHQSISEAIVMNKPIFVIPQRGQYEQRLNARMLAFSGRGSWGSLRNIKRSLGRFLGNLDKYPAQPLPLASYIFRNDSQRIISKIKLFLRDASRPRKILHLWGPNDDTRAGNLSSGLPAVREG